MTQSTVPTMSEAVDVDVDPTTAFTVFTEELEQWWGNGPIDAWDSSRVVSAGSSPASAAGSSRSTPTTPSSSGGSPCGSRAPVAWASSVDDVTIDVTFEPLDGGRTRVRVDGTATGPTAGDGFSFVRMTPQWCPATSTGGPRAGPAPRSGGCMSCCAREAGGGRSLAGRAFGFERPATIPEERARARAHLGGAAGR